MAHLRQRGAERCHGLLVREPEKTAGRNEAAN
jgi:hypothetical protein